IATTQMTAAMPIVMPRTVRELRSLFRRSDQTDEPRSAGAFTFRPEDSARLGTGPPRGLEHRLPHDFLDRRQAFLDLLEPRAAEGDHAFLESLPLDLDRGRAGEDELADLLGDLEDLHERDTTLVAGVVALVAALALHDLHVLRVLGREPE